MNQAAAEQLRQERETFELNKRQAAQWFGLQLCMGYCAVVMLVLLAAVCSFVLLNHEVYSTIGVNWATAGLPSAIVALLVTTWKLVLSPSSAIHLKPVTHIERTRTSIGEI